MRRYDVVRLVAVLAVVLITIAACIYGLSGSMANLLVLTLGVPLLVSGALVIGFVMGSERPEETHEYCPREMCWHARHEARHTRG